MNIATFATKGSGSNDEDRIRMLLEPLSPATLPFDKATKFASFRSLLSEVRRKRPDLLVMEGTGIAGGAACLLARMLFGVPYVVSSGDAVGPFVSAHVRALGPIFSVYERLLCQLSAGFIGWTPYLVGRAMTLGAPSGVTAAGWAPVPKPPDELAADRTRIRRQLDIADDALVIGIVGSLVWNARVGYCYGYELVRSMGSVRRPDVVALVVGGGTGLKHLERLAGNLLGTKVLLPGPVDASEAMAHMAAMDVGSLPQSVDGVGNFRYTTKISEYLAAGLPVLTSRIPMSYDLGLDYAWRLPGEKPWGKTYIAAVTQFMERLTQEELAIKRSAVRSIDFDREEQVRRVSTYLRDLMVGET